MSSACATIPWKQVLVTWAYARPLIKRARPHRTWITRHRETRTTLPFNKQMSRFADGAISKGDAVASCPINVPSSSTPACHATKNAWLSKATTFLRIIHSTYYYGITHWHKPYGVQELEIITQQRNMLNCRDLQFFASR